MSDERFYIGVDLGGTNIASAVVSAARARGDSRTQADSRRADKENR